MKDAGLLFFVSLPAIAQFIAQLSLLQPQQDFKKWLGQLVTVEDISSRGEVKCKLKSSIGKKAVARMDRLVIYSGWIA